MNIPPLISRTPPPLPDDDDDDDDDDEFGSYVIGSLIENGTSDIYHEIDAEALPTEYNSHPRNSSSNVVIEREGIDSTYDSYQHSIEVPKPPLYLNNEYSCVTESQPCENGITTSTNHIFPSDILDAEAVSNENVVEENPSARSLTESTNHNHTNEYSEFPSDVVLPRDVCENYDVTNELNSSEGSPVPISNHIEEPSDDAGCDKVLVEDDTLVATSSESLENFSAFSAQQISNGSLVCNNVDNLTNCHDSPADFNQQLGENENIAFSEIEEDEFSDFAAFQTNTDDDSWHGQPFEKDPEGFELDSQPHGTIVDIYQTKVNLVRDAEDVNEERLSITVEEFKESLLDNIQDNTIWTYLRLLDDTPALKYQWLSSTANHRLLAALKIDSRNIFCGPWNRSTKSLSSEVHLPMKITSSESPNVTHIGEPIAHHGGCHLHHSSIEVVKTAVPDAHFDWEGSGLVNPLFCSAKDDQILQCDIGGIVGSQISNEAQDVLKSLPDLSFMTKTYLVFKKIPVSH